MISFKDCVLILRVSRLGRIPPALASAEIIQEGGLPVKVVEFGNIKETQKNQNGRMVRTRFDAPFLKYLSKKFQFPAILVVTFCRLAISFLIQGRPKILVAHGLAEQFLTACLGKLFWIPYVVHAHEVYESQDLKGEVSQFLFSKEKWSLRGSSFCIFPEKKRAQLYRERYELRSPIFISANAPRFFEKPSSRDLRQAYRLGEEQVIMSYIGGVGPTNCLELAIQALTLIPRLVFLVWGWGERSYLNDLRALAHDLGVSKRFVYLGQLTEFKFETLAGCDLSYCVYQPHLLRTKYQATASNKLFEAMAVGIPSVMSSELDFYQFNTRYRMGVCAKSLSLEGVSNAIYPLVTDPGLRKQLGANGRKAFEKEFHYERQFHKPLQAYQDLYHGYPEIWSFNELYFPPEDVSQAA